MFGAFEGFDIRRFSAYPSISARADLPKKRWSPVYVDGEVHMLSGLKG